MGMQSCIQNKQVIIMKTVQKGVSFSEDVFDKLEAERGRVPRSYLVDDILREHFGLTEEQPQL